MVQKLGHGAFTAWPQVPSLVGELGAYKPHGTVGRAEVKMGLHLIFKF